MKRVAFAFFLMVVGIVGFVAADQQPPASAGPYSAAANFSADIVGTKDTRPSTWGTAGFVVKKITFQPPVGYRTHVLRAYGDFIAWPKGKTPDGTHAGVLMGLANTGPDGSPSKRCDYCADNTFLYIQGGTTGNVVRMPFNQDVSDGGYLQADNVLVVKFAMWLNDTGLAIHTEPTLTVVYKFEKN